MAGDASALKKKSTLAAAVDAVEKGSGKKGEVKATEEEKEEQEEEEKGGTNRGTSRLQQQQHSASKHLPSLQPRRRRFPVKERDVVVQLYCFW